MKTTDILADLVDELGDVQSEANRLEKRAKDIKKIIAASGEKSVDGARYRATVSTHDRTSLDKDKVRAMLSGPKFAACHTTRQVTIVRPTVLSGAVARRGG